MSLLFADLSNNNPSLDAVAYAKAGHLLLGLKVTEGVTFDDEDHARLSVSAHKAGVAVAHYHFAQPNANSAVAEARHFWRKAEPHFREKTDYLVLDLEVMHRDGPRACRKWARAFNREVRRISGHRCVLYTGRAFLEELGPRIRSTRDGFHRFWVAEYGPRLNGVPWARPVWAWQRTDGKVGRRPYRLTGCPSPGHDVNVMGTKVGRRLRRVLGRA